jgi:hypothetical protein
MTDAEAFQKIRDWMMQVARPAFGGSGWATPEKAFPPEVVQAMAQLEESFKVKAR